MSHLIQEFLVAISRLMGAGQSTAPNLSGISQGGPSFGQSPCCCRSGPDSVSQFLGASPAQMPPPSVRELRPQGSVFSPDGSLPRGSARTSSVSGPSSQPAAQGARSGSPNVEALVQALPPGRRQAASQHFPTILAECQRQNVTDPNQISYILATAAHESNAGQTMEEMASGRAYEGRSSLGNTQPGDGPRFKGRGYVQITGRRNYTDWSNRLGMDLVGNPDLATQPRVAARILVEGMMSGTFTGRALPDYVGNGRSDFSDARRVVNGTDRAADIAGIAERLRSALT